MKCSLPKTELLAHASRTSRIVNNNAHIPSQRGIRLETKKSLLIFTSTNLEMGVTSECGAKVEEEGVCIVPAKTFIDALKFTSGTEVTLTVQGSVITLKTSHGTSKIPLLPLEEFPPQATHTTDVVHEIPVSLWTQGIQSVLYAVSQSTIKPELASVYVSQQDTNIVFVGTDSFRLAEKKVLFQTEDDIPNVLIPSKNVHELQNILAEFPEEKAHFYFDDDQLSIKLSNVYVTTRLVTGTFPDYAKIIPQESTTTVTMLTEDVDTVFKKAAIFSDTTRQVNFEVVPEHKQCLIRAKNGTIGEMEELLQATIEGASIGVNLSGKYVSDCLQTITRDSVSFHFAGPTRPILIRGVGDPSYVYLVMPMNR